MGFEALEDIVQICQKDGIIFPEVILQDDCKERQVTKAESQMAMQKMYHAMTTADSGYEENLKSASGLVGGDGGKMRRYASAGEALSGDFVSQVMIRALAMGESNACMKAIVAAPTAGACGVLPAVLISYERKNGTSEDELIRAMYVAAGIGEVIATRAFISGAQGGCQAEIGSASAMAAGSLAYLQGGDEHQIIHAAAMALKNLLGLACDPVAGLVEVPCVKRNVVGAVNAVAACDMAMAGIQSAIPPDEVIDAMRGIGQVLPACIRETGEGGLAETPTGKSVILN